MLSNQVTCKHKRCWNQSYHCCQAAKCLRLSDGRAFGHRGASAFRLFLDIFVLAAVADPQTVEPQQPSVSQHQTSLLPWQVQGCVQVPRPPQGPGGGEQEVSGTDRGVDGRPAPQAQAGAACGARGARLQRRGGGVGRAVLRERGVDGGGRGGEAEAGRQAALLPRGCPAVGVGGWEEDAVGWRRGL